MGKGRWRKVEMTDGKDADDVFGRSPASVRARPGRFWSLRERNRDNY